MDSSPSLRARLSRSSTACPISHGPSEPLITAEMRQRFAAGWVEVTADGREDACAPRNIEVRSEAELQSGRD